MGNMLLLDNVINNASGQVEGFCIVKSVLEKINTKGQPYLDFIVADSGGELTAKLWDYDKKQHGEYSAGEIIKIRATISKWREEVQLKVERIRKFDAESDELDMERLVPCAPYDSDDMYEVLLKCIAEFRDDNVRAITLHILNKFKDKFVYYPAGLRLHHAQRCGLLYHTFTMLKIARGICTVYPELDTDLVYAGIILHDIAKVKELVVSELGLASAYSAQGSLIGHLALGAMEVEAAARELSIEGETSMLLEHIMLSHHGVPEFGSAQMPSFPEAEVVSSIDNLDARLYQMFDITDNLQAGECSERVKTLDGRQLYRHGHTVITSKKQD